MVKTEHNLSFIWNFMSLNQPLSSSTQLLSKQVVLQVSISQFPRTGESPSQASWTIAKGKQSADWLLVWSESWVHWEKKIRFQVLEAALPFYLGDSGCGSVLHWRMGCWMQQCMGELVILPTSSWRNGGFGMPLFSSCSRALLHGGFYFKRSRGEIWPPWGMKAFLWMLWCNSCVLEQSFLLEKYWYHVQWD